MRVAPVAACAAKKHRRQQPQVHRINRHSLRDGFNGFLRALPGDRALLPPSSADESANLAPASGRQDHTALPSAKAPLVRARIALGALRPPQSRSAFVTIAIRPSEERNDVKIATDLGLVESGIFFKAGLDDPNRLESSREIPLLRKSAGSE